jgi:hypothetical protein
MVACRFRQCNAESTKSRQQCKLCISQQAGGRLCHVHKKHAPAFRSNERHAYDPELATNRNKMLADDAMLRCLEILKSNSRHKAAANTALILSLNDRDKIVKKPTRTERAIILIVIQLHWFIFQVHKNRIEAIDSSIHYSNRLNLYKNAVRRILERKTLDALGLDFEESFVDYNVIQQPDGVNCGPHAIINCVCLWYTKIPCTPNDLTDRTKVEQRARTLALNFLQSRKPAEILSCVFLNEMCPDF